MARIFKTPFGAQGDTEQVPEAPQGDGSVSLTQGFGYDYEREYDDPAAKDIRREVMNGLFHDITEAVGDIQLSGIAKWDAAAAPYPAGAVVWHDSEAWRSTSGNNNDEPGSGGWRPINAEATETEAGIAAIATQAEVDAGVDDAKFVTSLKLHGAVGDIAQNIAVFDTAGTTDWSIPGVLKSGQRKAHVTVIGGGGGGARNESDQPGGGGGGGGVSSGIVNLESVSSVSVTVGAGGEGLESGDPDGPGAPGGSSSFGAYMSATGGGAGSPSPGSNGGNSGEGMGGDINYGLGSGSPGTTQGGAGSSVGGSGGGPGGSGTNASVNAATSNGKGYGGGGGGAFRESSGSGKQGIVIVRW